MVNHKARRGFKEFSEVCCGQADFRANLRHNNNNWYPERHANIQPLRGGSEQSPVPVVIFIVEFYASTGVQAVPCESVLDSDLLC